MYFALLMGTFVVGIVVMLAVMGVRQWNLGYRIAGGVSLTAMTAIVVSGIAGLVAYYR